MLTYQTPLLTEPVLVEGAPFADMFVRTTGTDADFVVKIIDVYPPTWRSSPRWPATNWRSAWTSFVGVTARASRSRRHPCGRSGGVPLSATDDELRLQTRAPDHGADPIFPLPLYDRNPQTFVPNIFFAHPQDYKKATISIERGSSGASGVLLPVVPATTALR